MKLTKEGRQLILFMVLGDGYLNKKGFLSVRHSSEYKDYAEWKRQILRKHGIKVTDVYEVKNSGYGGYEFRTSSYKFIRLYRRVIYKDKKNIANKRLLNKLTPLGLAIWYMDDGGLSQKKRNGKVHANELFLNTHLTKEENQVIIDYFKEKWDIHFTQVKNRGKYRLRCGTKEARKFLDIVLPYVSQVPSMSHKLAIKS